MTDDHRLAAKVLVLPRVEYDFPHKDKKNNNMTSMWVIWHPWRSEIEPSRPTLYHFGKEHREKYKGQQVMFDEEVPDV
ncbi:MAG: hypothetical protein ABEN55_00280 [Bradymonadaceae bacterium]